MKLFSYDRELKLVDHGSVSVQQALKELDRCYTSGLHSYDLGEQAISSTSMIIAKSESDFIELGGNGQDDVSLLSDRLHYKSPLSRFFTTRRTIRERITKEVAESLIADYFDLDRISFELKYVRSYIR